MLNMGCILVTMELILNISTLKVDTTSHSIIKMLHTINILDNTRTTINNNKCKIKSYLVVYKTLMIWK